MSFLAEDKKHSNSCNALFHNHGRYFFRPMIYYPLCNDNPFRFIPYLTISYWIQCSPYCLFCHNPNFDKVKRNDVAVGNDLERKARANEKPCSWLVCFNVMGIIGGDF